MRYSCKSSVEYDLNLHYKLLDKYDKKMDALSEYKGYRLKPTTIRGGKKYYSAKAPGMKSYNYVGGDEAEQVKRIRERAFYEKSIIVIRENIGIMEDFLRIYRSTGATHINELLADSYALRLDSPLLRDESDVEDWLRKNAERKSRYPVFDPAGLSVTAFDGTKVRSRAEAIHHEAFYIYGVPSIIELPYEIDGDVYRPDFTILDVFTMTDRMWEHLGNWFHSNEFRREKYRTESIHRIDQFAKIGFYPEFNLMLSFGTEDNVFDIQSLHRKVAMFAAPPPSRETMDMLKRL